MDTSFRLFPEQASTLAPRIDALYYFLCGLSGLLTLLISGLIVFFAIRYRSSSAVDRAKPKISVALEVTWIVAPALVMLLIFVWSAWLFFHASRLPAAGLDIDVVAKQWIPTDRRIRAVADSAGPEADRTNGRTIEKLTR